MIELDLEFNILEKLYYAPHHTLAKVDLANSFGHDAPLAYNMIDSLKRKGLIVQKHGSELVTLKRPEGVEQYLLEHQRRENDAKQAAQKDAEKLAQTVQSEKNKKQERRLDFIISIVSAIVGSLTTLCVEHFQELVDAISSFFSSLSA